MSENNAKKKMSFGEAWQKFGTIGIFVLLLVVLAVIKPSSVFSASSVPQILKQSSVNILLALGEFFAILIAGIDLSVGSVAALTGLFTAKMMIVGVPVPLALIAGILIGTFFGFINGMLVNKTGLHPFIITLGTQSIFRGITLVLSNSRSVYGFPSSFTSLMSGSVAGVPIPVIIALIAAIILWFVTTKCKVGRNIYALGGNIDAAWYSGINVNLHRLIVFMISGTCAGLAGVVLLV